MRKPGYAICRRWMREEDDVLREYFPTERGQVTLRLEGRTVAACETRAYALGVSATVVARPQGR